MYEIVKQYLEETPQARERKNKNRAIGNLIIKKYMQDMVGDILTADRAWRQVLEKNENLRGSDYNDKARLEEDKKLFIKIRNHLADLHEKWTNDKNKDGHCKSSEGYISVTASYPNWFEADSDKETYLNSKPTYSISVYSYLFGPNRTHDFYSFEEAWEEIKNWTYEEEFYQETAPNKFLNTP